MLYRKIILFLHFINRTDYPKELKNDISVASYILSDRCVINGNFKTPMSLFWSAKTNKLSAWTSQDNLIHAESIPVT